MLFAIPNFALGVITPYLVRLKSTSVKVVGESVGDLYAVATAGSIIGALITGYFLIPYLGIKESFFAISIALVVAGVVVFGKKGAPLLALVVILPFIAQWQTEGHSAGRYQIFL